MIRRRLPLLLASCLLVGCAGGDDEASRGRIAYRVLDQGYGEIWVTDADGSNARRVTRPKPAGSDSDGAKNPALSPDGKRIAYVMEEPTGGENTLDVYVVDVDGGEPVRLTNDALPDGEPAWSPDGKQIAFTQGSFSPHAIQLIDLDSGIRRPLIGDGGSPTWSPDGEQIAFARTAPGTEGPASAAVYVVDVAGGSARLLVDDALAPAWSPDGKRIAFVEYHQMYGDECSFTCGIHVVNADGTGLRRLMASGSIDTSPAWSPDGTEIVFMSDRTGHDGHGKWGWELYVMEADGSDLRRLTTNDVWEGDPDWR